MTQIPLLSGAYSSPSLLASAQRCVNLYPEQNPQEIQPEAPFTHRMTPGLTRRLTFPEETVVRGLFTVSTGDLYGVCGQNVYFISQNLELNFIGTIGNDTTPVSMTDFGSDALLVDGSGNGYQINLSTQLMSGISAASSSGTNGFFFPGSRRVDQLDGFIVGAGPGTPQWFSSADYQMLFDALSTGTKSGRPDPIQTIAVLHRYVWLIGSLATEIWYNAGGVNFPFAIVSGPYIEHGCDAPYSLGVANESIFWLSRDLRGKLMALEGNGYQVTRVSNHAIETEWSGYATTADAVGMTYQQFGHTFWITYFPTAGKTWAYDLATRQWHERVSFTSDLEERPWRVNCLTFAYGQVWAGDRENGKLYTLDESSLTDDGVPIQRRRSFPHIINEMKRVRHSRFLLDIDAGSAPANFTLGPNPVYTANPVTITEPSIIMSDGALTDVGGNYTSAVLSMWLQLDDDGSPHAIQFSNQVDPEGATPNPGVMVQIGDNLSVSPQIVVRLWDNAANPILHATYDYTTWGATWNNILLSFDVVSQQVQLYINNTAVTPIGTTWSSHEPVPNPRFFNWYLTPGKEAS